MKATSFDRVVLITLDGVGAGAAEDAAQYGDSGADTLGHVAEACGGLYLPTLQRLGLGLIHPIAGVAPVSSPQALYGRMRERSAGKDTTTGHWELAGIIQTEPFPTYPKGFPEAVLEAFRQQTGLDPLGNIAASGTEILKVLGEEHVRTGRPIVYTSADSVFQIAAHEAVIPVEKLYEICRIARRILDSYRIGRVIARPFTGDSADSFRRTSRRHDFSLRPTDITVLDRLVEAGLQVYGVGKIRDIFAGYGITDSVYSKDNREGMSLTLEALSRIDRGLVFTNLVDFDMMYGHRLDAIGFGRALEEFDCWLPRLLETMHPKDLLILTADHGCDPTTEGTDHTREHVPLLVWHKGLKEGKDLGLRGTFADVAATLGEALGVASPAGQNVLAIGDSLNGC